MKVVFSPRAKRDAAVIARWWHRHRSAAPFLFVDELSALVERLEHGEQPGTSYPRRDGMRRAFLRGVRYYVYYSTEDEVTSILAIWQSSRGREPQLT